ncbi:MAG TPA: MazG nucleotide pyrophosphohydrolase domain-containing protein [Ktedonobacterales bacterium]|jgi:NTP pyrophosphatase (non-canonical NTP hydrolase)|nr:MazG nucleotide pyrophosphohydrolase domain-containing protein [Ktedonobacterales bacterium]
MSDQRDAGKSQAGARPAPMTLAEAQHAVDAAILALGGYWPPLANLARLFEECGELARVVNQMHGPKLVKSGESQRELSEEFGDILFVTLGLAQNLGVDAEEALRSALDRSARRVHPANPSAATPPAPSTPAETDL